MQPSVMFQVLALTYEKRWRKKIARGIIFMDTWEGFRILVHEAGGMSVSVISLSCRR